MKLVATLSECAGGGFIEVPLEFTGCVEHNAQAVADFSFTPTCGEGCETACNVSGRVRAICSSRKCECGLGCTFANIDILSSDEGYGGWWDPGQTEPAPVFGFGVRYPNAPGAIDKIEVVPAHVPPPYNSVTRFDQCYGQEAGIGEWDWRSSGGTGASNASCIQDEPCRPWLGLTAEQTCEKCITCGCPTGWQLTLNGVSFPEPGEGYPFIISPAFVEENGLLPDPPPEVLPGVNWRAFVEPGGWVPDAIPPYSNIGCTNSGITVRLVVEVPYRLPEWPVWQIEYYQFVLAFSIPQPADYGNTTLALTLGETPPEWMIDVSGLELSLSCPGGCCVDGELQTGGSYTDCVNSCGKWIGEAAFGSGIVDSCQCCVPHGYLCFQTVYERMQYRAFRWPCCTRQVQYWDGSDWGEVQESTGCDSGLTQSDCENAEAYEEPEWLRILAGGVFTPGCSAIGGIDPDSQPEGTVGLGVLWNSVMPTCIDDAPSGLFGQWFLPRACSDGRDLSTTYYLPDPNGCDQDEVQVKYLRVRWVQDCSECADSGTPLPINPNGTFGPASAFCQDPGVYESSCVPWYGAAQVDQRPRFLCNCPTAKSLLGCSSDNPLP